MGSKGSKGGGALQVELRTAGRVAATNGGGKWGGKPEIEPTFYDPKIKPKDDRRVAVTTLMILDQEAIRRPISLAIAKRAICGCGDRTDWRLTELRTRLCPTGWHRYAGVRRRFAPEVRWLFSPRRTIAVPASWQLAQPN